MTDIEELRAAIDSLPEKFLNTEIEVTNNGGPTKRLTLGNAVKENWQRTVSIEQSLTTGSIYVPVENSEGIVSRMQLKDIIKTLNTRPERFLKTSATVGENLSKLLAFLIQISGIIYAIWLAITTIGVD